MATTTRPSERKLADYNRRRSHILDERNASWAAFQAVIGKRGEAAARTRYNASLRDYKAILEEGKALGVIVGRPRTVDGAAKAQTTSTTTRAPRRSTSRRESAGGSGRKAAALALEPGEEPGGPWWPTLIDGPAAGVLGVIPALFRRPSFCPGCGVPWKSDDHPGWCDEYLGEWRHPSPAQTWWPAAPVLSAERPVRALLAAVVVLASVPAAKAAPAATVAPRGRWIAELITDPNAGPVVAVSATTKEAALECIRERFDEEPSFRFADLRRGALLVERYRRAGSKLSRIAALA